MKSVWREYGVIGTLLVVAVGGYLYMSNSEIDVLNASLQTIGNHLLSLVPDAGGRRDVEAALDTLRMRVADGEVDPDHVERFAASVFNIGTSGASLTPQEARMVVRLAYSDGDLLPGSAPVDAPPPRPAAKPVRPDELARLAGTLQPMVAFFETVQPGTDSLGPAFRFYSDGRLHVVVDDRLREQIEKVEQAKRLLENRTMSWRAHFAEAAEAESRRFTERAEHLVRIAEAAPDSIRIRQAASSLARLNRLRALGLVSHSWIDSVMVRSESAIEADVRALPPPPPAPPAGVESMTSGASVSSSGSNSGR